MFLSSLPIPARIAVGVSMLLGIAVFTALIYFRFFWYKPTYLDNDTPSSVAYCEKFSSFSFRSDPIEITPGETLQVSKSMDCGIVRGGDYQGCIHLGDGSMGRTILVSSADGGVPLSECDSVLNDPGGFPGRGEETSR